MVRFPRMTTPSTRMEVTLVAPCRNRLATEPVRNLRLLRTSSRVLDGLSWRLLVRAHAFMWANSSATVEMLNLKAFDDKKAPKKILRIERIFFLNLRKICFWPPAPPIFLDRRQ